MSEEQQSISQILQSAREQRDLDLDAVYRQIGISLPVLQGMENDRFDIIEPVFARMALQSYAEFLRLDPKPLIALFDQQHCAIVASAPVVVHPAVAATPGLRLPLTLDRSTVRTIGLGLGVLLILLLAISFFGGSDKPKTAQAPPPEPAPIVKSSPARTEPAATTPEMVKIDATPEPDISTPAPVIEEPEIATAAPTDTAQQTAPITATNQELETTPATAASELVDTTSTALSTNPDSPLSSPAEVDGAAATTISPVPEPPRSALATTDSEIELAATDHPADVETQAAPAAETRPTSPTPAANRSDASSRNTPSADVDNSAPRLTIDPDPITTEALASSAAVVLEVESDPITTEALASSAAVVLEVESLDSTWVQIRWDGNRIFEGIVPRGERRRFEASDHFLVLSGRAHGLRYWLNGELLGNGQLGDATKVLRFRAATDGIEFLGPDFTPLTGDAAATQP